MRHITISVLSVIVMLPAVANARLPVVNLSSGGVSARGAFGEGVAPTKPVLAKTQPRVPVATRQKKVVARAATDSGGDIFVSNDVLAPRRPSGDLWAKNDFALRMPTADEFSVIRSDAPLPEESLDKAVAVTRTAKKIASDKDELKSSVATLDSQIERLIDLQNRATASVRTVSPRPVQNVPDVIATKKSDVAPVVAQDVSLRRMVVPMSDDVVVRSVEKNISPRIVSVRDDMTKMSPSELRRAFRKTFLSENKHLSTYSMDDSFDVVSDMTSSIEGFSAKRDLSEQNELYEGSGIRPLEIKIKFRNEDSALSRENYTLLTEYAGIVVSKPTRAIQVAIPQHMTKSKDARKLAARRLAIVEQVLTDNGVSQQRIVPVLSSREESGFVLRVISSDQYETLTQRQQDIFGDTINKKTYKSMSW